MMPPYEDEASELLWKYVEELKRTEAADAVNFIACTPVDPAELAKLMPLADAVHKSLQDEVEAANGHAARARLVEAIRADRKRVSKPQVARPTNWLRFPTFPRTRQVALALLLLLAAIATGLAVRNAHQINQQGCETNAPAQSVNPASPAKLAIKHH